MTRLHPSAEPNPRPEASNGSEELQPTAGTNPALGSDSDDNVGAEPAVRRVVEGVIEAYRAGRVRLWLTNLADAPDLVEELGQWAGVVRIDAEAHARRWEPDWRGLSGRLARRHDQGVPPGFQDAVQELLPLAREEFGRRLESKQVPRRVAEKAKSLFSITPPVQQWKM